MGYKENIEWVDMTEGEKRIYEAKANDNTDRKTLLQICCHPLISQEFRNIVGNIESLEDVEEELIGMIVAGDTKNTAGLDIPKPDAFELFFSYINLPGTDMPAAAKYGFYDSAFNSLYEHVKLPYDEYLDKIIDTIDVYGLGFTLQYILNCFKRHNAVSEDFYTKSSALFAKMFDPEITNRVTDIKALLDEYEDILLETGLLTRLKKAFENNNLIAKAPMPSPIMRLAEKQEASIKLKPLSSHMERVADMDPVSALVNTKAKALVNTKAKALVKTSKVNLKPSYTMKVCPPEKELNPVTNRCIKKCAPDQVRNPSGRCVKNNTRKRVNKSNSKSKSKSRSKTRSNTSS